MASLTVLESMDVHVPSPAYQSILGSNYGVSDSEARQTASATTEEDVDSIVGISISKVQTRLKSPTTPAAEKAAALDSLWGDGFVDPYPPTEQNHAPHADFQRRGNDRKTEKVSELVSSDLQGSEAPMTMPTPWISGPKLFETNPAQLQRRGARRPQPRSSTGLMGNLVDLNVKRFISTFAMPSSRRPPSLRDIPLPSLSSFVAKGDSPVSPHGKIVRGSESDMSQSSQQPPKRVDSLPVRDAPLEGQQGHSFPTLRANGKGLCRAEIGQFDGVILDGDHHNYYLLEGSLKRTTSDQSLALLRATSIASSLGDDSRWEHVQKQVNSRAKAISDSLQDSRIKLPSLPGLPAVNLRSLRPEFFRERASSDTTKPSWPPEFGRGRAAMSNNTSLDRQGDIMRQMAQSRGAGVDGLKSSGSSRESDHQHFGQALESLTGDIVVLGGYRGSILRSAKPPHRQLWVPIKVGLNIRKVNLEVGLEPEDEEKMEETIIPSGMLSHIGPIDMGRRLLKRLRSCRNAQEGKLRVHDYGYDWRLSPHLLSRRLIRYLEQLSANAQGVQDRERGAIVIAHSLGGLITRHAVNQRPELFAGIVYAGVPQYCVNILGPLRNGDEVLLSSKVLTAQVNFTFRTSFLLLPESGRCFIDKRTKEAYPVNFFDPADWKRYAFSPCTAPASPPYMPQDKKGLFSFVTDSLPSRSLVERISISSGKGDSESSEKSAAIDIDAHHDHQISSSSSTKVARDIIPRARAEQYLTRTLTEVVRFKEELKFISECAEWNVYPPLSILYSRSIPTVYGARVASRAAIQCSDAYDDLAFADGDGVCLARAAMLPKGYEYAAGGKVKTERGHVGLLGDLEAVGKCLMSIMEGRKKGVGLGPLYRKCVDRQKC
ncbi:MAG: hypothetical protein LQ338_005323 [Usnochroma carphineum]|nr:MAG: hypothetical protein LQ338_005323 [Usnochroma carphineum]